MGIGIVVPQRNPVDALVEFDRYWMVDGVLRVSGADRALPAPMDVRGLEAKPPSHGAPAPGLPAAKEQGRKEEKKSTSGRGEDRRRPRWR